MATVPASSETTYLTETVLDASTMQPTREGSVH